MKDLWKSIYRIDKKRDIRSNIPFLLLSIFQLHTKHFPVFLHFMSPNKLSECNGLIQQEVFLNHQ